MTNHAQARAEGRAEGIREAAAICEDYSKDHGDGMFDKHSAECERRILALLDAPSGVTQPAQVSVAEAAKVLQELVTCVEDGCYCSEMKLAAAVDEASRFLRALSEETCT